MVKRCIFIGLLISFILIAHCGLFQPDTRPGSLRIIFVQEEVQKLQKPSEELSAVQCIVKKGAQTVYDGNLTKQENSFHGEITDLEPGSDYSVILYGKNASGEIIARAYQDGIGVTAGEETTVTMSWDAFTPTLLFPTDGNTICDATPTFDWTDVVGAADYELTVDNDSTFSSSEIHDSTLTTSEYTPTSGLSDDTYYWRVRCKDSQGNWGGWSEKWSLIIDATTEVIFMKTFGGSHWDWGYAV